MPVKIDAIVELVLSHPAADGLLVVVVIRPGERRASRRVASTCANAGISTIQTLLRAEPAEEQHHRPAGELRIAARKRPRGGSVCELREIDAHRLDNRSARLSRIGATRSRSAVVVKWIAAARSRFRRRRSAR